MPLHDLKISTRLTLGFALMGLLIVLLGTVALVKSRAIQSGFDEVAEQRIPRLAALNQMDEQIGLIALAIRDMYIVQSPEDYQARRQIVLTARKNAAELLGQLQAQTRNPEGQALLTAVAARRTHYVQAQDQYLALLDKGNQGSAREYLLTEVRAAYNDYLGAIGAAKKFQNQLLDAGVAAAHADVRSIQTSVWASVALALLAAAVLAWRIIRAITQPLAQAVQLARAVADGDLAQHIDGHGRSETAQLLAALGQMLSGLRQTVGQVRGGSSSVASASNQIAQANLDLSARTEQQASALEQTAAAMEQLGSTVRQNADSAHQANALAQSASSIAARGGSAVAEVVQTMAGIQESSQRIADIIGTIDSIAFQTNILALNAAVEAARAGEQGRGFAVVAGEVRTLAQRAAQAAKEIKQLIDTSVARVATGTEQVDRAGATMQEVVQAIGQVTALMGEISAASVEQSQGVSQVGEAVTQMDQATQQNAALVEEMAAAASSLQGQAQQLVQAVAVFRTGETADAPPELQKQELLALS